jgi:hypothetical protein
LSILKTAWHVLSASNLNLVDFKNSLACFIQHLPRREFKSVMTIPPLTHSRSLALGQV